MRKGPGMLTDERRAEIEAVIEDAEADVDRDDFPVGMGRELLAEIDRLNEVASDSSELAATTIAGLEMENARLCRLLGGVLASFDGENLKWRRSMLDELLPVIAAALPDGYVATPWEGDGGPDA
jgi:hypothetical protein